MDSFGLAHIKKEGESIQWDEKIDPPRAVEKLQGWLLGVEEAVFGHRFNGSAYWRIMRLLKR